MPETLPDPREANFFREASEMIVTLLETTRGRAFVLSTSYRGMNAIREFLEDRLDYRIFCQGESPKHMLIQKFREDIHSVLIATASFWQGVDVPGEALSCVVIDKLPFSPPNDPIVSARIRYLKSRGIDAFMDYQLPEAVMALKQGVGRLIRNRSDRGLIAILDKRLRKQRYGSVFLDSLPDFAFTTHLSDVTTFFNNSQNRV